MAGLADIPPPPRSVYLPPSFREQAPDVERYFRDVDTWLNLMWRRLNTNTVWAYTAGDENLVPWPTFTTVQTATIQATGGTLLVSGTVQILNSCTAGAAPSRQAYFQILRGSTVIYEGTGAQGIEVGVYTGAGPYSGRSTMSFTIIEEGLAAGEYVYTMQAAAAVGYDDVRLARNRALIITEFYR